MSELIFFNPFFKQVLWGGSKMRDFYGYSIPGDLGHQRQSSRSQYCPRRNL